MRIRRAAITIGILGAVLTPFAWDAASAQRDAPTAAGLRTAAAATPSDAEARRQLRAQGPAGLRALLDAHREDVERLRRGDGEGLEGLRAAIDVVSGQRDGHASGLYWHTDLEAAKREAARRGLPILSLRLLGRLDEELSCANSRYFRIVLYADPNVAQEMSRHFVLHWSSERPAPVITIDMGDGRELRRTITGNSVHYVLDARGRPLDAIVGLYSPGGFRAALVAARQVHGRCRSGAEREACLASAHEAARAASRTTWARAPLWLTFDDAVRAFRPAAPSTGDAPSAAIAMPLTIRKAYVETPALALMGAETQAPAEPDWAAIGRELLGHGRLSVRSRALLRLKTGRDDVTAIAERLGRDALADGVRNEVRFRDAIRGWFVARDPVTRDLEALNRRVYTQLLLTPESDPWLGLRADDLYDGIEVEE